MIRRFPSILTAVFVAATISAQHSTAADDLADIKAVVAKQHDEGVKRIQDWIKQVSIAAEDRGYPEGAEYMAKLAKDAGFQQATIIETGGKPGVFATYDVGAPKTLGLYFMYDVKQYNPEEWSSPPTEAAIVDRPGFGKAIMGRAATNQKGPQATFLAALHAIKGAGKKLPVNLVLVAEGEEEIGSPNIDKLVYKPEVQAALKKTMGVFMPFATQDVEGNVQVNLGAKGMIEVELVASGEKWGRGPAKTIHSSLKAMVDSPSWHLVKALNTLVSEDGNEPAIENLTNKARPLSAEQKAMIAEAVKGRDEAKIKKQLGVQRWINDLDFQAAQERLVSQPTVNIEGLVGGYTGPGGMTILPHKAAAKLDLRIVPDMTATETLAALKAHLAKRGFGDIEVTMTGGYDSTSTAPDSKIIQAQLAVLKRNGVHAVLWPRLAGSYPGYIFTNAPLSLPAGHFGLGHGGGAHAPDEYYLIESTHPKIQGYDGAVMSYVEYLYELAK